MTLKLGESELIANSSLGFIERFTSRDSNGEVRREIVQLTPKLYHGAIVFPSAMVEADYRDGKLSRLTASLIDEVRFNEPLPPDAFSLSVPAGTTVVDPRKGSFRPRVFSTEKEIADVAQYIRDSDQREN